MNSCSPCVVLRFIRNGEVGLAIGGVLGQQMDHTDWRSIVVCLLGAIFGLAIVMAMLGVADVMKERQGRKNVWAFDDASCVCQHEEV